MIDARPRQSFQLAMTWESEQRLAVVEEDSWLQVMGNSAGGQCCKQYKGQCRPL